MVRYFEFTVKARSFSGKMFFFDEHNFVSFLCSIDGLIYFDNVMTKFIVNHRTDSLKTDINLFFTITNGRIARSRSLTRRMNFKFMCLSAY